MIHKCETATNLSSGAVVGVTLSHADLGDTATVGKTLEEARENLAAVCGIDMASAPEVVADKGCHSNACLERLGSRTYISEPERGRRR